MSINTDKASAGDAAAEIKSSDSSSAKPSSETPVGKPEAETLATPMPPANSTQLGAISKIPFSKTFWIVIVCGLGLIVLIAILATAEESCRPAPPIVIEPPVLPPVIANTNANITNLLIEGARKEGEVSVRKEELENKRKGVNNAKNATNNAISNIGIVANTNFAGTNSKAANSARCEAFRDAPEC